MTRTHALSTPDSITSSTYIEFMAGLGEVNRPPGGLRALFLMLRTCGVTEAHHILDVGCNTGFTTLESVRLTRCRATGIDLSPAMIQAAKGFAAADPSVTERISFEVGDATNLSFPNSTFDCVISGGSTAFISDRQRALIECQRVLKPWGFFGEIFFFYSRPPPPNLLVKLNTMMGTQIEPLTLNEWLGLYKSAGLQVVFSQAFDIAPVTEVDVENYVEAMVLNVAVHLKGIAANRLRAAMTLFNENHKYLSYCICVMRRCDAAPQPWLFCP